MPFDFLKDSIINASRNGTKHIKYMPNNLSQHTISKMFDPVVLFTFLIVLLYQFYQ